MKYLNSRIQFSLQQLKIALGLSQISPRYRARIADRLDAFEDGMVDVVQRLGQGLTGIHWKNGQSRVANMASIASRWSFLLIVEQFT